MVCVNLLEATVLRTIMVVLGPRLTGRGYYIYMCVSVYMHVLSIVHF